MLIFFYRKNDFENYFKKSEDLNSGQFLAITNVLFLLIMKAVPLLKKSIQCSFWHCTKYLRRKYFIQLHQTFLKS